MNFIQSFNELSISDRTIAGGKGASLGQLTTHSFQVPEGFVIVTSAFDHFLAANGLIAKRNELRETVEEGQWDVAEEIALQLHEQILAASMPEELGTRIDDAYAQLGAELVAIRSSAVSEDEADAAWAGILSTYLNTNNSNLLRNLKLCWASLFSRRAIHYLRSHSNTSPDLNMAVVVQRMVESEISGVAFSIHPVNRNSNQIVIEAALGLGEEMVSGAVTPDNYLVDKRSFQILHKSVSAEKIGVQKAKHDRFQVEGIGKGRRVDPKLNDQQIVELAKQIAAIESVYAIPVDVEWAWADQQFYILQSRPVSHLGVPASDPDSSFSPLARPSNQESEYEFWWSDHLAYWAHDRGFDVLHLYRDIVWNQYENFFAYIKDGTAFAYLSKKDMESATKRGEIYLQSDYLPVLEQVHKQCVSDHQELYQTLNKCSYPEMSNQEILELFRKTIDTYSFTLSHYKASGPLPTKLLHESLSQYFSEEELHIFSLPTHLDIMNLEQLDWIELLKHPYSKTRLLEHAAKHSWFFMSHFTYDEVIETLTQLFHEDYEQSANDILSEKQKLKEEQEAILEGREEHIPLVHLWQAISSYRTTLKGCWASVDFHLIPMFDEICRRSGESIRDLTSYYRVSEIARLLDPGEKLPEAEKIRRESGTLGVWSDGKLTYYFGQEAEQLYREKADPLTSSDLIQGIVANRGNVRSLSGKARILECNHAAQVRELGQSFREGDILVTPIAQLNIWHIIKRASAIVTDEGGMLSHAAIVARESNIPCIVGTRTATFLIKDGDMITLDLIKGIVRVDD